MMKYKHILPDGVAVVSFSKFDFHFFQQDKSRALRPSWFPGDGVRLLFLGGLVNVWEQSVENSFQFVFLSSLCPGFPAFRSLNVHHSLLLLDLSHSGCTHPDIFHCPFFPKFHSNIPALCLSPHIHRHEYLLTAGCVFSPGPNQFFGNFFSAFFHFPSPPTPRPAAHTL